MKKIMKVSTMTIVFFLVGQVQAGDVLSGTNTAKGTTSVIAGGDENSVGGDSSVIAGGNANIIKSHFSAIIGGKNNAINLDPTGTSHYSVIAGGLNNASSHSDYSFLGSGRKNAISSALYGVISGGYGNRSIHSFSTVSGGKNNQATAKYSTIAGGANNKAGDPSRAGGEHATVGGGVNNESTGISSFTVGSENKAKGKSSIAMGHHNEALSDYSIAIGNHVKANKKGSFAIGDSNAEGHALDTRNTPIGDKFYAYFKQGYSLNTASHHNTAGVYLNAGDSAWNTVSDKNKKENFQTVDIQKILNKLIEIPIESWNYKAQSNKVRHIGLYAQQFNTAYGLGDGKLSISTIDSDGVALASVQALAERNKNLSTKNTQLESKVNALEERLLRLEEGLKNK